MDQNCVYLQGTTAQRLLYVIKFEADHKLTVVFIQEGLQSLDVMNDIVNAVKILNNLQNVTALAT